MKRIIRIITTWRLVMRFSLMVLALPLLHSVFLSAATISGNVAVTGGRATKAGLIAKGVIIWLDPVEMSIPVQPKRAVMVQRNKMFQPHLLVVGVGSGVDFPNLDPIFHNAFSSFDGQVFDVALYPPGKSRTVSFGRTGVVRVFCNIHPSMSAVILVLDTPYWVAARSDGNYSIGDVRPGTYLLHVFHESSTPEALKALTRQLNVVEGANPVPLLTVSESGYLPMPHKNKYGKDYPIHAADQEYSIPQ